MPHGRVGAAAEQLAQQAGPRDVPRHHVPDVRPPHYLRESLQKRTGVFSLEHYLASRTLLWAGHVARMPKNRLPKRPMLSWIREPCVAGGQEVTYGRSLQRHLNHFDLPTVFTEWAHMAQDRAGWHKLVTTPPFAIGKPFVRQPRGDTRA